MSDAETLLIVLIVLYLSDCLRWVHRNSVSFVSPFGLGWQLVLPSVIFGNRQGGLLYLNPLPPLGTLHICQSLPVSFSPEGMCSYITQEWTKGWPPVQVSRVIRYEDIKAVAASSNDVLINSELFVRCQSTSLAESLAHFIRDLARSPAETRGASITEQIEKMLDPAAARGRIAEYSTPILRQRISCISFFLYLFVLAPLVVFHASLIRLLPELIIGALVIQFITLGFYYHIHKSIHPRSKEERITNLIKMLLCPPTATRAIDVISRNLLERFHPITVAYLLCSEKEFQAFAQRVLLDLRYPLGVQDMSEEIQSIDRGFRRNVAASIESFIEKTDGNLEALLRPQFPEHSKYGSFCPRCLCGYIIASGQCADCVEIDLVPIASLDGER